MKTSQKRILLLGDDMRIFLTLARSFGRAGHLVHAAPYNRQEPALSSRYIHEIHDLPNYFASAAAWKDTMRELMNRYKFDLIVPCIDPGLIMLDETREMFDENVLAIPSRASWDVFFDKAVTHDVCDKLGVKMSKSRTLKDKETGANLAKNFGLPLVIKPARSYYADTGHFRERVYILETISEIDAVLKALKKPSRYLVESYFEGSGTGISVLAKDGVVHQAFQHRRLREGRGGSSSYRISEPLHHEMLEACRKLCAHTSHSGVCMFEFRRNRQSGEWILLEINSRFWGSMPLPISIGVDFPNQLLAMMKTGAVPKQVDYPVGIRSRNLVLDAFNLGKTEINSGNIGPFFLDCLDFLVQPYGWLTGKVRLDTFVADDMKPGFIELARLPIGIYRKSVAFLGWKEMSEIGNADRKKTAS